MMGAVESSLATSARTKLSAAISPNESKERVSARTKLSAPAIASIEEERLQLGVSKMALVQAARISPRWYHLVLSGHRQPGPTMAAKLRRGLKICVAAVGVAQAAAADEMVLATYGAYLALITPFYGLSANTARTLLDKTGEHSADPLWRKASHARAAALYLVNQTLDVRQITIARALGLSGAAVCMGVRAVEDRRDGDAALDRALAQAALDCTGRDI